MWGTAWCRSIALLVALLACVVPHAEAQSTASISGVVKDTDGSVLPGVTVIIKEESTGQSHEVTTDGEGRYQATALSAGSYTVSATLAGFKTATAKSVRLAIGQPIAIALTLEIGQLEETVIVTSSSELINTENGTVAATLNADQLTRMPTPTRNALNAVAFLPGVNTTGTNRDSTINGLPESFLSITLDGVSNNDNFLRNTDGFFASVTPRQDAIEAVSVTLSAGGAQVGGGAGAVTMAFQTRSGGNRFTGSGYEYYRNPSFNSNYVFNEINKQPKNEVKLNTFGARVGGPIVVPGLYDGRNKAFFFFHYEQIRFPNSFTRTRTVFNPRVYDGWFRYQFQNEVREVNLLSLAAANGQIATKDPTSMNLQMMIDAATKTAGTRSAQSDPLYDNYVWQSPSELFEHQPTVRLDYNLSDANRLSGSWSTITAKRTPDYLNNTDPRFPGAPNQRDFVSTRPLLSTSLRSVVSRNIINELRGGLTAYASGSNFGYPSSLASRNDPSTFSDSGGFAITTPTSTTDWFTSNDSELAQGADLQHREHTDLEPRRPYRHDRRQRHDLGRLVVRPDDGAGNYARVQHRLRPGRGTVHQHELPRRIGRSAGRGACDLRRPDRPRRDRRQHRRPGRRQRPVPRSWRKARSRAATRSSACSCRIRGG